MLLQILYDVMMEYCNVQSVLTGLVGIGLAYVAYTKFSRSRLPPGPFPLPVLGSALWVLGRPLHATFGMLQQRYGDIVSLRVGSKEVVIINGYDNIHQALVKEGKKFNGRPDITWTSITQKHGLFSTEGTFYQKQKPIITSILSALNWSRSDQAEQRINRISEDLIAWLQTTKGAPVNPQIYLDTAVCNVNTHTVIGAEFKPTDDLMVALSKIATDIFLDAGPQNVNNYFTFLRHFPGDPTNYRVLVKNATTAMSVMQEVVNKHKQRLEEDPDAQRRDFIDHYLDKIKAGDEPTCTESQLVSIITDLVAMGIEATATTLRWALLLAARNKEVQQRLQSEIDDIVMDEAASLEHKSEMPYTNAFIAEVQRYANVVSINLPHSTTEDVTFAGFEIPKGAVIVPNLASVHFDAEAYPEPLKFKPERHMEGKEFVKPSNFMPYSLGTRMCFGKVLSEMEIFLFLVALLKNYEVKLNGGVGKDNYGLIRYPGAFKLEFISRSK